MMLIREWSDLSKPSNVDKDADELAFEAEKKTSLVDLKSTLAKPNALKRVAVENQENLDSWIVKKNNLIYKKCFLYCL